MDGIYCRLLLHHALELCSNASIVIAKLSARGNPAGVHVTDRGGVIDASKAKAILIN